MYSSTVEVREIFVHFSDTYSLLLFIDTYIFYI